MMTDSDKTACLRCGDFQGHEQYSLPSVPYCSNCLDYSKTYAEFLEKVPITHFRALRVFGVLLVILGILSHNKAPEALLRFFGSAMWLVSGAIVICGLLLIASDNWWRMFTLSRALNFSHLQSDKSLSFYHIDLQTRWLIFQLSRPAIMIVHPTGLIILIPSLKALAIRRADFDTMKFVPEHMFQNHHLLIRSIHETPNKPSIVLVVTSHWSKDGNISAAQEICRQVDGELE